MIFVCDNFLKDPFSVRKDALNKKYFRQENTPGYRCLDVDVLVKNYIFKKIDSLSLCNMSKIESAFQYSTGDFKEGLFHTDYGKYTCIVFLSLEPIKNSGTEICDSGILYNLPDTWADDKHRFFNNRHNFFNKVRYNLLLKKINSKFTPSYTVNNIFNRMVVFDSCNYHRAQKFFGTSISDSRLTLVSFLS